MNQNIGPGLDFEFSEVLICPLVVTNDITFCFCIFFCSVMSVTRFSLAMATSCVSVLSGNDSGESESFSLSSLLKVSFLLSPCHFFLLLKRSCSQLDGDRLYFNNKISNQAFISKKDSTSSLFKQNNSQKKVC